MKNKITSYGFLLQTTKRKQSLQSCSLGWMHEYVLHLAMVISWMNSASYRVYTWFTLKTRFDIVSLGHAKLWIDMFDICGCTRHMVRYFIRALVKVQEDMLLSQT